MSTTAKGPGAAETHDGRSPSISSPSLNPSPLLPSPTPYSPTHLLSVPPGSSLRIAIIHARWNPNIITPLVSGCRKSLLAAGVQESNIHVESVPGSYELPFAVQRVYTASQIAASQSQIQTSTGTADLLSSASTTDLTSPSAPPSSAKNSSAAAKGLNQPFDALIAIGVLIKGETMHFEYIADAVSHGLMKVQVDAQVPVVFGVLTVLSEEQGLARAGMGGGAGGGSAGGNEGKGGGHNHGEDWGEAAVELGVKGRGWREGKLG
ncbi:MAG: hypothetical protein Q9227_008298 [Pyrenula ochraceoflavens]